MSKTTDCLTDIQQNVRGMRLAVEQIIAVLADRTSGTRVANESEAISWLIRHMQTAKELPNLSECARQLGVDRRLLRADKWDRFRDTYDRLAGMKRGADVARAIIEDEE
jgi:hypothetical protein